MPKKVESVSSPSAMTDVEPQNPETAVNKYDGSADYFKKLPSKEKIRE